jgi:hypothetical protein
MNTITLFNLNTITLVNENTISLVNMNTISLVNMNTITKLFIDHKSIYNSLLVYAYYCLNTCHY